MYAKFISIFLQFPNCDCFIFPNEASVGKAEVAVVRSMLEQFLPRPVIHRPLTYRNGIVIVFRVTCFHCSLLPFFTILSLGFLDLKSYPLPWLFRWRQEERADFLKQFHQLGIVKEEDFLNLTETFLKIAPRCEFLSHSNKGTDNINAHGNRRLALENVRGHQRPVLGEGMGKRRRILE